MMRLLISTTATIVANAVGLLLAAALLQDFRIDALSFVVVLLVFTGVMILTGPLVTKIAISSMPQIRGSIALVTAFIGLKVTEWLMPGFTIGEASNWLSNWLAATLLVWLGSLIAEILLPLYVFKSLARNQGSNINIR
ncbi:MAG: hypothetical protein JJT81_19960 [Rubellimicrobium sp.]|nr:hypothetical protein [Rubellimicrobium sp.]